MVEVRRLRIRVFPWLATFAFAATFLFTKPAAAQLHMDAAAEIGGVKRFAFNRAPGSNDAGIGPAAQLSIHFALIPLLRVGAYVAQEIAPVNGTDTPTRDMTSFGVRAKLMSPFPQGNLKLYFFAGFGFVDVYQRSYHATLPNTDLSPQTGDQHVLVQGAGGSFFEIPVGIGATYKLFGAINLVGELGAHIGFGFNGSVYGNSDGTGGPQITVPGQIDQNAEPVGNDAFAVGLTVGVLLDL